ncbi:MAG: type II secretion system F family protein [Desulfobacteraceae bacterium]|nr:MAG: type II secretion system F family protein [Desulfobacteraceae bacterium]
MIEKLADIPILMSALGFLTIFLVSIGIWQYFHQKGKMQELMEKIQQDNEDYDPFGEQSSSPKIAGRLQSKILTFLGSLGKHAASDMSADYPKIRIRFLRAGFRRANVPAVFWGAKTFLAICLPVGFILARITVFKILNVQATLAICLCIALLGFYLPDIWLHIKITGRKAKILEGLPDAIDLLVVCVEAGMGIDAAFNRVGEEMKLSNKALSDEFKLLNLELRAGMSRRGALQNFALRTDIEEVSNLVTLLIQTDRFGTSVSKALRTYSDAFRTKRYQKAEQIAAKIPVKLVFPTILFIFPSLFVAILGPAAIRIYEMFLVK